MHSVQMTICEVRCRSAMQVILKVFYEFEVRTLPFTGTKRPDTFKTLLPLCIVVGNVVLASAKPRTVR